MEGGHPQGRKESVVAERHGGIGERHLELLRIAADLARNEPAAVAQMYRAAQRMNLDTVGKPADRVEFLALVRDLEGAGCVEVRETALATSYGRFSVTEEGHRQLAARKPLPEAPETAEEELQRAQQQRRRRRPASGGPQEEGEERARSKREEELRRVLENLGEERQRREAAERERDALRRELEQLPRPARPWWVLGLLLIVVVVTLVALSLGAILSPP